MIFLLHRIHHLLGFLGIIIRILPLTVSIHNHINLSYANIFTYRIMNHHQHHHQHHHQYHHICPCNGHHEYHGQKQQEHVTVSAASPHFTALFLLIHVLPICIYRNHVHIYIYTHMMWICVYICIYTEKLYHFGSPAVWVAVSTLLRHTRTHIRCKQLHLSLFDQKDPANPIQICPESHEANQERMD